MPEADSPVLEEFPFPLTEVDRHNLTLKDSEYQPHTWEELKQIIGAFLSYTKQATSYPNMPQADNKLEILRRWPSDLKRYIKWSAKTKADYGSIMNFVMQKRLKWTPSSKSTAQTGPLFDYKDAIPFANSSDYKVMPNDWPYGLDQGISHLIVWLKTRLPVEPTRGDLTPEGRTMVERFVKENFREPLKELPGPSEKVMWFKNWVALQSVPGIDHIHILVRDVPQEMIDDWTGGEKPVQSWTNVV